MIIHVPPGSPALVRDGAALILALHIGGGCVGVVSGATALLSRKGGFWHRTAGDVFVVAMLFMGGIGAAASPFLPTPQPSDVVVGVLAYYLVATGWAAARRKDGGLGRIERAAIVVPLLTVAAMLTFAVQALTNPQGILADVPFPAMFVFAAVASLLAAADVSVIVRGALPRAQRIARHLWRMCVGLLLATGSAIGQPKIVHLIPEPLRQVPILLTPVIAIVAVMTYWLVRVGSSDRRKPAARPPTARMAGTAP